MGWANNKRFWVGVHDQATDLEYKTVHGDDMPFASKHELYKNYCDVILSNPICLLLANVRNPPSLVVNLARKRWKRRLLYFYL